MWCHNTMIIVNDLEGSHGRAEGWYKSECGHISGHIVWAPRDGQLWFWDSGEAILKLARFSLR